LRLPSWCRSKALAALVCLWPASSPAFATTQSATINASVSKPLEFTWIQDFDLGTITFNPGVWSNVTVSLSQAGVLSCASANLTCTGATKVARYNVAGSQGSTVLITCPNITLTNQTDPTSTLTLVTSAPPSVYLTNSGRPGTNFNIGGSITLSSTISGGTYAGTFNVTADYQ
jgi:hypothetical protein